MVGHDSSYFSELHWILRIPVFLNGVVAMNPRLPATVLPRDVTELRRISQLLLGYVGAKTTERRIVSECAPRDRIVTMAEAQESAETHDSIGDASRDFVDDEVVDLADALTVRTIDFGPLDVLTRNAVVTRTSCRARHGTLLKLLAGSM